MGTSFTKLILFVHKVSIIINKLFLPLREMLCAGKRKLCVEGSEIITPFVFQPVSRSAKASSKHPLQGAKKWKQEDAKSET
jgi:hypothetical protein